jgi:hypothetical protein
MFMRGGAQGKKGGFGRVVEGRRGFEADRDG